MLLHGFPPIVGGGPPVELARGGDKFDHESNVPRGAGEQRGQAAGACHQRAPVGTQPREGGHVEQVGVGEQSRRGGGGGAQQHGGCQQRCGEQDGRADDKAGREKQSDGDPPAGAGDHRVEGNVEQRGHLGLAGCQTYKLPPGARRGLLHLDVFFFRLGIGLWDVAYDLRASLLYPRRAPTKNLRRTTKYKSRLAIACQRGATRRADPRRSACCALAIRARRRLAPARCQVGLHVEAAEQKEQAEVAHVTAQHHQIVPAVAAGAEPQWRPRPQRQDADRPQVPCPIIAAAQHAQAELQDLQPRDLLLPRLGGTGKGGAACQAAAWCGKEGHQWRAGAKCVGALLLNKGWVTDVGRGAMPGRCSAQKAEGRRKQRGAESSRKQKGCRWREAARGREGARCVPALLLVTGDGHRGLGVGWGRCVVRCLVPKGECVPKAAVCLCREAPPCLTEPKLPVLRSAEAAPPWFIHSLPSVCPPLPSRTKTEVCVGWVVERSPVWGWCALPKPLFSVLELKPLSRQRKVRVHDQVHKGVDDGQRDERDGDPALKKGRHQWGKQGVVEGVQEQHALAAGDEQDGRRYSTSREGAPLAAGPPRRPLGLWERRAAAVSRGNCADRQTGGGPRSDMCQRRRPPPRRGRASHCEALPVHSASALMRADAALAAYCEPHTLGSRAPKWPPARTSASTAKCRPTRSPRWLMLPPQSAASVEAQSSSTQTVSCPVGALYKRCESIPGSHGGGLPVHDCSSRGGALDGPLGRSS
eukprot:scaffold32301_cov135-Isochrysis_galbana.AAC.22